MYTNTYEYMWQRYWPPGFCPGPPQPSSGLIADPAALPRPFRGTSAWHGLFQ